MDADAILKQARNKLSAQHPQGRFSSPYLLEELNNTLNEKVIPDLYSIGGYNYLYNFVIAGSISLTESARNKEWMEGDLSTWVDGSSNTYVFYIPSLTAMVDGDSYRIPVNWLPFLSGYMMDYDLSSYKPRVLGTIKGQTIYIYTNDYDTLYLEAIQIKTYAQYDLIDLDDHIAKLTLVPAICSEAMIKDKGINMHNIFEGKYGKNLRRLERDSIAQMGVASIIPKARTRGFYGLRERM
jgi:hypothetical protein